MPHVTIATDRNRVEVNLELQADWISCLIPALLAGLPGFLDAFMKCITNGDATGNFTPGTRPRCD